jgi:hypothetical protein
MSRMARLIGVDRIHPIFPYKCQRILGPALVRHGMVFSWIVKGI